MVENYRPHFRFTWRENWGIAYTCTQVSAAILLCCLAVSIPAIFLCTRITFLKRFKGTSLIRLPAVSRAATNSLPNFEQTMRNNGKEKRQDYLHRELIPVHTHVYANGLYEVSRCTLDNYFA
jgi:hypothetical protein